MVPEHASESLCAIAMIHRGYVSPVLGGNGPQAPSVRDESGSRQHRTKLHLKHLGRWIGNVKSHSDCSRRVEVDRKHQRVEVEPRQSLR
jgi:hypothetical protein